MSGMHTLRTYAVPLVALLILVIAVVYWYTHPRGNLAQTLEQGMATTTGSMATSTLTDEEKAQIIADLDLATLVRRGNERKAAGDYAGAASVWERATEVWVTHPVAYNNLGDLYMNFLKDPKKAETNYLKVVELDPKSIDAYMNLFYIYRDLLKNQTKAQAILDLGLKNNPGNQTLQTIKDSQ
jgi:tetratricopeptide (TPR) repeat protein